MEDQIWFILFGEQKEGPYSLTQLKNHPSFTPDTYVWKEGFPDWKLARDVPEIQEVFKDEPSSEPEPQQVKWKKLEEEDEALILDNAHNPFPFWLILLALFFLFLFYQYFWYQN
jgi:hypothetical protein